MSWEAVGGEDRIRLIDEIPTKAGRHPLQLHPWSSCSWVARLKVAMVRLCDFQRQISNLLTNKRVRSLFALLFAVWELHPGPLGLLLASSKCDSPRTSATVLQQRSQCGDQRSTASPVCAAHPIGTSREVPNRKLNRCLALGVSCNLQERQITVKQAIAAIKWPVVTSVSDKWWFLSRFDNELNVFEHKNCRRGDTRYCEFHHFPLVLPNGVGHCSQKGNTDFDHSAWPSVCS